MKIKTLLFDFISLFYPVNCLLCNTPLTEGEKYMCLHCIFQLPKTHYDRYPNNDAEERFKGKIPYIKVSSFLYYSKGGNTQKIISQIKYKNNPDFGEWIGSYMAKEMINSSFFDEIDVIVPVPLHAKKQKLRGFNQSESICNGIKKICNLPVNTTVLYRKKDNLTQTKKGVYERWENTSDIFGLRDMEYFRNKHILIIDDVLTTGSTIEACAHQLLNCEGTKISVLTLAIA